MVTQIELISPDRLLFDRENPRLVEFSIGRSTSEESILNILWTEMAVNELVLSITAHGFFKNEAILCIKNEDNFIVVEGNRRLAAIKAILYPEQIHNQGMVKYQAKITDKLKTQLQEGIPVIVVSNRQEAWGYIGFKHVNGAAKWGSYAKAQYIAKVHNDFGIPLDDIAEQIGDENNTVVKLYQGLMFIHQAEKETSFDRADTFSGRLPFSHLYTAITQRGYREYLNFDPSEITETPVPKDKIDRLEEVMLWLFGSKSKKIRPVVVTQNPDLGRLNNILQKKESLEVLKSTQDLSVAFEYTLESKDVLYSSLIQAKVSLEKASSKISAYDGSIDTLKLSGTVANMADTIYNTVEKKYNEQSDIVPKQRITE